HDDQEQQHAAQRSDGGIQFAVPKYLFDAPPTLAPGGGAEALHPAHAAQWFTNSGFTTPPQYAAPTYTAYNDYHSLVVQDAYQSLSTLTEAFPQPFPYSHDGHAQQFPPWSLCASPSLDEPPPLTAGGLPVYSQSGFDIVSLLARVQNRANPTIRLGPVDFTTAFVVVDVRRHDDPVVYCSPNFCTLTGYAEREVLGRNCRFLQAPPPSAYPQSHAGGLPPVPNLPVSKGDPRPLTSLPSVRSLAKSISARKETQVSLVNYRADGSAFVNLVSVVPLFGEHVDDPSPQAECVWMVGFQIDLSKASEGIVERVREGRYYSGAVAAHRDAPPSKAKMDAPAPAPQKEKRSNAVPAPRVSAALARLLVNPRFLKSCGIAHPPPALASLPSTSSMQAPQTGLPPDPTSHALHSLLLEQLPDFVHVLSLKGAFLYVAPAVTRVLGWSPTELVGRAIADLCFSRDVVSVGRALKEASLPVEGVRIQQEGDGAVPTRESTTSTSSGTPPALTLAEALRTVDLVFRARTKGGAWVWVECRGRLHVEPGKGRKAIVLVGRARGMAHVPPMTRFAGGGDGATFTSIPPSPTKPPASGAFPPAFHGLLDPYGLLLSVGAGVRTLLGYDPLSLRGTRLGALVAPSRRLSQVGVVPEVERVLRDTGGWTQPAAAATREVRCTLQGRTGPVDAIVRLVAPLPERPGSLPPAVAPPRLMYAVWLAGAGAAPPRLASSPGRPPPLQLEDTEKQSPFRRLDPATGGSWQYELQQLKIANARLKEEVAELERAEEARMAAAEREREREREQERERERERERAEQERVAAYQHQQQQAQMYGYEQHQHQQQWGYALPQPYQLPMKRPWDRREH
ncbi:blue light receptor, partial [Mycena sanguinolenta]